MVSSPDKCRYGQRHAPRCWRPGGWLDLQGWTGMGWVGLGWLGWIGPCWDGAHANHSGGITAEKAWPRPRRFPAVVGAAEAEPYAAAASIEKRPGLGHSQQRLALRHVPVLGPAVDQVIVPIGGAGQEGLERGGHGACGKKSGSLACSDDSSTAAAIGGTRECFLPCMIAACCAAAAAGGKKSISTHVRRTIRGGKLPLVGRACRTHVRCAAGQNVGSRR